MHCEQEFSIEFPAPTHIHTHTTRQQVRRTRQGPTTSAGCCPAVHVAAVAAVPQKRQNTLSMEAPKNTHTQNGTHRGRKKHKPVVKAFCSLALCSICVLCMCFLHIKSIRRSLGGEIGAIVRGSFHRVSPPRLYQVSTCVCVFVGRPWLESFPTQKMRAACKRLK